MTEPSKKKRKARAQPKRESSPTKAKPKGGGEGTERGPLPKEATGHGESAAPLPETDPKLFVVDQKLEGKAGDSFAREVAKGLHSPNEATFAQSSFEQGRSTMGSEGKVIFKEGRHSTAPSSPEDTVELPAVLRLADSPTLIEVDSGSVPRPTDLAVTSTDEFGGGGQLNRLVMNAMRSSEALVQEANLDKGYDIVATRSSHVAVVVTVGSQKTEALLENNLARALSALSSVGIAGRDLWIPLLGTGAGRLPLRESLRITLGCLKELLPTPTFRPRRLRLSFPLGLTDQEENEMFEAVRSGLGGALTDKLPTGDLEDFANWVVSDAPITDPKQDLLGFDDYAHALFDLLNNPRTLTPFVLSIHAPWGAGKSTLGRLLQRRFTTTRSAQGIRPSVTCWFNAWQHDDAENLATALCADVARSADRTRPLWRKALAPLPIEFLTVRGQRIRRIGHVLFLVALFVTMGWLAHWLNLVPNWKDLANESNADVLKSILGPLAPTALTGWGLWRLFGSSSSALHTYVKNPASAAASASMEEVRRLLGRLIREGTPKGSKFVLFIDDIERCRPPRSVDLLEAVNQLLMHEDVVIVLVGDMRAVAAAVEIKYKAIAERDAKRLNKKRIKTSYGQRYLQKIVQLEFELPSLSPEQVRGLLKAVESKAEEEEADKKQTGPKGELARLERLDRLLRGLRAVAIGVLGFLIFAWIVQIVPIDGTTPLQVGALVLAILAPSLSQRRLSSRVREQRTRAQTVTAGELRSKEVSEDIAPEILAEQEALYLTNDSDVVLDAFQVVLEHVAVLPRNAKRLLNRLRLQILLAKRRNLLSEETGNTDARQIAKWVALEESWPSVAFAARKQPHLIGELEDADAATWERTLKAIDVDLAEAPGLSDFFASEPRFGERALKIVQLRADS